MGGIRDRDSYLFNQTKRSLRFQVLTKFVTSSRPAWQNFPIPPPVFNEILPSL